MRYPSLISVIHGVPFKKIDTVSNPDLLIHRCMGYKTPLSKKQSMHSF